MDEIEFKAGYYEWHIYINGKLFYAFDADVSEEIPFNATLSDLEYVAEDYINCMQMELEADEKEKFNEKYIPELKKLMVEEWAWHLGIDE